MAYCSVPHTILKHLTPDVVEIGDQHVEVGTRIAPDGNVLAALRIMALPIDGAKRLGLLVKADVLTFLRSGHPAAPDESVMLEVMPVGDGLAHMAVYTAHETMEDANLMMRFYHQYGVTMPVGVGSQAVH